MLPMQQPSHLFFADDQDHARSDGRGAAHPERLAGQPDVTYLATAAAPDGKSDPDWAQRIAAHRAGRPPGWKTAEGADAAEVLRNSSGAVLLDGIGTWLAGIMDDCGAWDQTAGEAGGLAGGSAGPAAAIDAAVDGLIGAWRQAPGRIVAVSDEVGSGVVPATRSGRLFRDRLGQLNQRLAAESEEVVLVVAGRILTMAT